MIGQKSYTCKMPMVKNDTFVKNDWSELTPLWILHPQTERASEKSHPNVKTLQFHVHKLVG
jgi:hypothetical protein